ncbi:SRPBCC family protein [Maricurvus nonylphenolicus]|uniref:SRPBCC family protein n=1 Tax=Maricurvus nonylphenolicus TaxID=1008307 RepID=UPI0036F2AFC6
MPSKEPARKHNQEIDSMLEIVNTLEIDAPIAKVWSVLTDRENYPRWNPVIHTQHGELRRGCRGKMRIQPMPGPVLEVDIIYQKVEHERELSWYGGPPLVKGYHYFQLKSLADGKTLLIHGERFGWLATLLSWPAVLGLVKQRYHMADQALQAYCEASGQTA